MDTWRGWLWEKQGVLYSDNVTGLVGGSSWIDGGGGEGGGGKRFKTSVDLLHVRHHVNSFFRVECTEEIIYCDLLTVSY